MVIGKKRGRTATSVRGAVVIDKKRGMATSFCRAVVIDKKRGRMAMSVHGAVVMDCYFQETISNFWWQIESALFCTWREVSYP